MTRSSKGTLQKEYFRGFAYILEIFSSVQRVVEGSLLLIAASLPNPEVPREKTDFDVKACRNLERSEFYGLGIPNSRLEISSDVQFILLLKVMES